MEESKAEEIFRFSKYLCMTLGAIVLFGLIMVYSSSYIYAMEVYGSSAHYFMRQLYFVLAGLGVVFVISKTKVSFWLKYGQAINILATLVVLLTFIPGFSSGAKGATRWIVLAGFRFQPGEILKFTVILSGVSFFENFDTKTVKQRIYHMISILAPMTIIVMQPDFGTFSICAAVLIFSCFMSKFSRKYFYLLSVSGVVISTIVLFSQAYRVNRLLSYLDPWKNPKTSGFQIIQSYLAFANGSVFGQGLGNSTEKLFYLPEAHNDFIFSIVGAELGFVGVVLTVCCFLLFIYFGFRVAISLKERIHTVLCSTIVFSIGLQAFLNMGVVLGLLPTKGLNLPFISAGGSSMLANAFGVGLLLSAVRYSLKNSESFEYPEPPRSFEPELASAGLRPNSGSKLPF